MKIRNFTPHPICFYHESDVNFVSKLRKYYAKPGAEPYLVVESEGMLSIEFENERVNESNLSVPIYKKLVNRMDRLPEIEPEDLLVVSAVYASYRHLTDTAFIPLFCIKDTVYSENGAPIGCLGLCKA
jgi:hypothetical protein